MNICNKCGGNLILTTYSSTVCTQCGSEKQVGLTQEPIYQHSVPLDRSYSRPDRWKGLIRKLTGHHNGPNTNDPVWEYLKKNSPFKGPQEIIQCLRKSKLLNKHYQSTFIFSKIFSTLELPMESIQYWKTFFFIQLVDRARIDLLQSCGVSPLCKEISMSEKT